MVVKWQELLLGCLTYFFADDSLLFFQTNLGESSRIKECLRLYEKASGQLINFQKSSISFSRNVNEQCQVNICDFFQVVRNENRGTYLGLPSFIGRNKNEVFGFIKDKVWKRIQ